MSESNADSQVRKSNRSDYLDSAKLEGMELTEQQKHMFDMFDQRGWTTEQRIEFVKKQNGYV